MSIFFPVVNIVFLVILWKIHRNIFYITTFIEVFIYIVGVIYIEDNYSLLPNLFLYYLFLSGVGLIIGFAAFFIAITLNHKHLYNENETGPQVR